jgi:FtsH-binding integral membrane protein
MIQRIQTVFMLLFVLTAGVNFFLFPSEIVVFEPVLGEKVDSSPYISILLAILVFVNIGFYKKRRLQVLINQLIWILYTLFWGSFVFFTLQNTKEGLNQYLPDLLIAFVGKVALLLANRYIRKDEALIRSLDRLR